MSSTLYKLYRKKRALLEDAETKVRIAASQSRKEIELAGVAYQKLRKIEELLSRAEEQFKTVDVLARKHLPRKHTVHKLSEHLSGLRTLHDETREVIDTLSTIKKKAHRNIQHLHKDFKSISAIKKKMDRHLVS